MKKKTGEDYRKGNRERARAWRQKKIEQGYKNYNIMLSPKAQEIVFDKKETTGESIANIIDQLIINSTNITTNDTTNINNNVSSNRNELKNIIKNYVKQKMSWRGIARALNEEGIPTLSGKGKWSGTVVKKLSDEKQKK